MGTLHEDLRTFMILSHSVLLITRNILDKSCRENENIHFLFNNFLQKLIHLYDDVKNMVQQDRPQMTI
jgi:hypothetical protein